MGFRFRRTFKILPGVKLNINKDSIGLSVGPRGAKVTVNSKGKGMRTTVGAPGSGLSFTDYQRFEEENKDVPIQEKSKTENYCPVCGIRLQKKAKFCMNCGTPVEKINESANAPLLEPCEPVQLQQETTNKINYNEPQIIQPQEIPQQVLPVNNPAPIQAVVRPVSEHYQYETDTQPVYNEHIGNNANTIFKRMNRKPFFIAFVVGLFIMLAALVMAPTKQIGTAAFVTFFIFLAVISVFRLHDLNHSGWWSIITFVPYLNFALLVYLFISEGTDGENRFGPDPLKFEK